MATAYIGVKALLNYIMGKNISLKNINTDNESRRLEPTHSLKSYLTEIRNHRIISQTETDRLFWLMRNGSKKEADKARERLVKSNQRFVYALAKRYTSDEDIVMDLVQEGNVGLLIAIQTYEPNKGYKFLTYAVHYIRREMTEYLTSNTSLIQKTNLVRTATLVPKVKRDFFTKEQRNPTDDEVKLILEDEYGLKVNETSDVYDLNILSIDSTMLQSDGDEMSKNNLTEYNNATASHNTYLDTMDNDRDKALVNAYLSTLPKRDSEIIKKAYGIGYDYEHSYDEIADEMHITKERVRQIINATLENLRNIKVADCY